MRMTKTMLVNKDARNSEATHLVYAPGHFDPTAPCPNVQLPTQIPGLLSLTFIRCTLLYPLCSCPGPRYLCYSLDVAFKHACSTSKLKSHRFSQVFSTLEIFQSECSNPSVENILYWRKSCIIQLPQFHTFIELSYLYFFGMSRVILCLC